MADARPGTSLCNLNQVTFFCDCLKQMWSCDASAKSFYYERKAAAKRWRTFETKVNKGDAFTVLWYNPKTDEERNDPRGEGDRTEIRQNMMSAECQNKLER